MKKPPVGGSGCRQRRSVSRIDSAPSVDARPSHLVISVLQHRAGRQLAQAFKQPERTPPASAGVDCVHLQVMAWSADCSLTSARAACAHRDVPLLDCRILSQQLHPSVHVGLAQLVARSAPLPQGVLRQEADRRSQLIQCLYARDCFEVVLRQPPAPAACEPWGCTHTRTHTHTDNMKVRTRDAQRRWRPARLCRLAAYAE